MSDRGITGHGRFKAFLTRGIFKPLFKPMLYKKEDYVHSDFLNAFLPLLNNLNLEDNQVRFVAFWLYIAPKELFEEIFIANENGVYYLTAVKDSNLKNGHLCAYYTQAFVLWHLEQFLKNSEVFRNTAGINIEDFEYVLTKFYGAKNLTMQYLNEIRVEFDLTKMEVDPSDWGIIYVYTIYDLLINDTKLKADSIRKWNEDLFEKMGFTEFVFKFFAGKKDQSILILNS